jgi:Serine/Threonine/Tyrosine Kinase found in polyvalent proteins
MKDELRHVISGKSQVRDGTTIQATASFLKRSSGTSKMVKSQKHYKKQETESLKIFITQNKLWIEGVDIAQYISEGAEQKVYLSADNYVLN